VYLGLSCAGETVAVSVVVSPTFSVFVPLICTIAVGVMTGVMTGVDVGLSPSLEQPAKNIEPKKVNSIALKTIFLIKTSKKTHYFAIKSTSVFPASCDSLYGNGF
jgi:hypothetical protein